MSKQVQVRRDTETNLNLVIPADGEIAYNTTKDRIHMGNGAAYGGIPHPNLYDILNQSFEYINAGGTANALTVSLPYAPLIYGAGLRLKVKATATNTGAATINVNGLGVKNIFKVAAGAIGNLIAGDLINGVIYELNYDGTQFQLLGSAGGLLSVSQGNLNTSVGSVSTSSSSFVQFILAGGAYGFFPSFGITAIGAFMSSRLPTSSNYFSDSNFCVVELQKNSGAGNAAAAQRYITSSPPFDLGDGETGGFVYALVNDAGDIVSHYAADVPPWAYNGPTNIRCDFQCPITNKKYRKTKENRTLEEIMDGAESVYKMEEITMAIKNADMGLIPHPFGGYESGLTPILLDPMDERIKRLIDCQNDGDDHISEAISKSMIRVDNDSMSNRKNPTGCPIHRMKFKYSGKKK